MPELPEVETVVRQLAPVVEGRRIDGLELLDPLLGDIPVQALRGRRVERVLRVGKQAVFQLGPSVLGVAPGRTDFAAQQFPKQSRSRAQDRRTEYLSPMWLVVHLRMTGRLLWQKSRRVADPQHLRARLLLDRGCVLFVDTRRFGTIRFCRALHEAQPVGLDPLSEAFTVARLGALLRGSSQEIKPWLLRQDRLVGLGNIYACEILFEARIDPWRAAGQLTRAEIGRLHACTVSVLRRAIAACGTTFSDFQGAHGLTGSYQRYLQVYQREGEPCPVCTTEVKRVVQQQRSTFYCPRCQRGRVERRSRR